VPPPHAVWRCFQRARTARAQLYLADLHVSSTVRAGARQVRCRSAGRHQRASRRARGACLRQTQSGVASCAHALHGPALLARPSRYTRCVRRCPASPLPQRRTPPARQPQSSRCVPPPDAVWRCFLRARIARASSACQSFTLHATVCAGARQVRCRSAGRHQRASRRARGACLRQTQSGVASCAHALRGPSSAWQSFTLHALCAQVAGKFAAAAPDATSAPAADLAVRATLAIARPWQPSVGTHALHEPLSA